MLRAFRECDLFRKLPPEHREAEGNAPGAARVFWLISWTLIAVLVGTEFQSFAQPRRLQRFGLDMKSSVDASAPRKLRVLLNVTVHDFPCVDLSLDYQDVMGARGVDVKTTVFKQRLHKNGSLVPGTVQNDPKAAPVAGSPSNPSITKNSTGNATCGTCYGALPDGECCNTCSDVLLAYRLKRWALPRIESISQCKSENGDKSAYQPPQIMRLDDYSSEDFLPKFSKLGSLSSMAGSEARISTPFRWNLTWEPSQENSSAGGVKMFKPLVLNFSDSVLGGLKALDDPSLEGKPWPDCVHRNTIVHGYDLGEALMANLTAHGAKSGCWNDDCSDTDKFDCPSMDRCAEVCREVPSCHWWTHGIEDGRSKCWIRTGKHGRERRYGFSSGPRSCMPAANATTAALSAGDGAGAAPASTEPPAAAGAATTTTTVAAAPEEAAAPPRRLSGGYGGFGDTFDDGKPLTLNFGPSLHYPVFGLDTKESRMRQEQKGESCRIEGYFDTNKVPGNFHIGTHGISAPSYLSYYDSSPTQNMQHTINSLAFVDVGNGVTLNDSQPLDGFESPKAFTFQYYLTITPATVLEGGGRGDRDGYQFRAGSFVTNELIGPAVFFRLDIDPIRVTYYAEEVRWSSFLVDVCAVVGGVLAMCTMLSQFVEAFASIVVDKE